MFILLGILGGDNLLLSLHKERVFVIILHSLQFDTKFFLPLVQFLAIIDEASVKFVILLQQPWIFSLVRYRSVLMVLNVLQRRFVSNFILLECLDTLGKILKKALYLKQNQDFGRRKI